jgi:glycosyltransferase involved in cell wall biosynthesis
VYNGAQYLARALKSVVSQTYKNLEIIVVNDGSIDETADIANAFSLKDKRVRVLEVPHRGLCNAKKSGIEWSNGTYIGFLDGDDYVDRDYYEKLYHAIKGVDLAVCGYTREYEEEDGCKKDSIFLESPEKELYTKENIVEIHKNLFYPTKTITPMSWNKLFHRQKLLSCFDNVHCDEILFGEDVVLTYQYILRCQSLRIIKEHGYYYTVNRESLTEKSDEDFLFKANYLYKNCREIFDQSVYREELSKNLKMYLMFLLRNRLNGKYLLPAEVKIPTYYFPWYGRMEGKRIVLYGAGEVGQEYYARMKRDGECEIVMWVDKNAEHIVCGGELRSKHAGEIKGLTI